MDEYDGDYTDGDDNLDGEEDLTTATLMSVHLDTFLEKRYKWYHMTKQRLPRVIRLVVELLMDIFSITYHSLMFWAKHGGEIFEDMVIHAREISLGTAIS